MGKDASDISGVAEFLLHAYFIEHAGGNLNLQELVRGLDEIDAFTEGKSFFAKTSKGWRAQLAA